MSLEAEVRNSFVDLADAAGFSRTVFFVAWNQPKIKSLFVPNPNVMTDRRSQRFGDEKSFVAHAKAASQLWDLRQAQSPCPQTDTLLEFATALEGKQKWM